MQYQRHRRTFASAGSDEDAVKTADVKLLFIPLVFIMLRIWSIIADPFTYFVDKDQRTSYRKLPLVAVLFLLRVSDSD